MGLIEAWARGIAANPQTPVDVLVRLLEPAGRAAWETLCGRRALPEEVVDVIVAHPETGPRELLAGNPYATPQQRGRMARDPDAMVRCRVAGGPKRGTWLVRPLPDDVLETFYLAEDSWYPPGLVTVTEIVQELDFSYQVPARYTRAFATHPDPRRRRGAVGGWVHLTEEQRAAFLADPDPSVRAAAQECTWQLDRDEVGRRLPDHWTHQRTGMMMHYAVPRSIQEATFDDTGDGLYTVAYNPFTFPDIVARLARHESSKIRIVVAERFDLDPVLRDDLRRDPDPEVCIHAEAYGAATTREQHVAITIANDKYRFDRPKKIDEFVDLGDADWYARAAISDNLLLRRAAALDARLPEPAVRALAADPDERVRALLSQNHLATPPATMIAEFVARPEHRALLLTLPHMPRTGLADLLDHPDPGVRAFAAADATLPNPPLALLNDPDAEVRRAAAANPLLPDHVLDHLLHAVSRSGETEQAEGAAANPRLDTGVLRRLLEAVEAGEAAQAL